MSEKKKKTIGVIGGPEGQSTLSHILNGGGLSDEDMIKITADLKSKGINIDKGEKGREQLEAIVSAELKLINETANMADGVTMVKATRRENRAKTKKKVRYKNKKK